MKNLVFIVAILFSKLAFAIGDDGCYLMYKPGVMYPVFCIMGSAEEGIGGSNATLVMFHVNSGQPEHCFKTSAISKDFATGVTSIYINDKVEMTLKEFNSKKEYREGEVQVGSTKLNYDEISPIETTGLLEKISASGICQ